MPKPTTTKCPACKKKFVQIAKHKCKGRPKAKLRDDCDKVFRDIVRSRGACEIQRPGTCKGTYQLQTAHLMSRRYDTPDGLRFDEANAWASCGACHFFYTGHPTWWRMLLVERLGIEAVERLEERTKAHGRPDYNEVLARLKERAQELGLD